MAAAFDTSQTAWISRGFEVLADRVNKEQGEKHFDVLIVGSGYGGAVAADAFAGRTENGKPISVGVLERGKEYLAGAFPTGLRELPRHIRTAGYKEGLFDIRLGAEVNTVVANGLGGGSLINAGVMEVPSENVFATGWPAALSSLSALQEHFGEARELLGSRRNKTPNTIRDHPDGVPQKFRSIEAIAPPGSFRPAEITVAMVDTASSGDVALNKCVRCGDCATGCNFGAKNSLDLNLLVRAHAKGAEIFSGATVLQIEYDKPGGVWVVHCVHTNAKLRARDETETKVRAAKVVLAAGTLGSTEILLRSKEGLALSERLGEGCSTNGDMLIARYDTKARVNTVADEAIRPSERAIGPTITGVVDLRTDEGGLVIEEMSVPAGLRRAFTEIFATIHTLHGLDSRDWSFHRKGFPSDDIYCASPERIERTALYAVMGDDGAAGTIKLQKRDEKLSRQDDGIARMEWPERHHPPMPALPDSPLFDEQVDELTRCSRRSGGRVVPNPVWKLLPKDMEWLVEQKRGPLTTVHPLGGCAMADNAAKGVVDDCGRVFDPGTRGVHPGLVVLDGSIIPTALGINPALTITAVALRAVDKLAGEWGYDPVPSGGASGQEAAAQKPLVRPVCRSTDTAFKPVPTEVEIIERLVGPVMFRAERHVAPKTRIVEITLRFKPKPIADLCGPPRARHEPVLVVANDSAAEVRSRIRIYDEPVWREMERRWSPADRFERELEAVALLSAPVTKGTLRVFERTGSWVIGRVLRAGWAWLWNRGLRDVYQAFDKDYKGKDTSFWSRLWSGIAVASRGGEVRVLAYDLEIGAPEPGAVIALVGTHIKGRKRFTYNRRANPWRQLMQVELEEFPGMEFSSEKQVIELDLRYLARIGVPLFRITRQQDGATALAELASFFSYFVRLLLGIHIWSFRAPDRELPERAADGRLEPRKPERLPPRDLPDLRSERHNIDLAEETPDLQERKPGGGRKQFKGKVILTRYRKREETQDQKSKPDLPTKPPLLMLHGYSASGTTFAHGAVPNNFATFFAKRGRDVWVADLRTSAGQKESAEQPWSFEQIGRTDVCKAIAEVCKRTKSEKIDVLAHCMGTVVFSIAVLGGTGIGKNVRRAAFTQVGPLVVFSPANVFRAYVLRYLIDFLPAKYSFRPEAPTLADDLLDRLLATLPYPVEEFDLENPPRMKARTPWTRTRHRMDALYGRDFNVANMEEPMLKHIDDHFGPLSLRTVTQTLNFVRYSMITNFEGVNQYVSRKSLVDYWTFPTFSVHGAANGLADVSTVDRMRVIFEDAGRVYLPPHIVEGAGHQDALIGTKRAETLAKIEQFFDEEIEMEPAPASTAMVAYPPWIGPIITEVLPVINQPDFPPELKTIPVLAIRIGTAPTHRSPEGVVMIRVAFQDDRVVRPDSPAEPWDADYVTSHMAFYRSSDLSSSGWDAFFAPRAELMPGFTGQSEGDALLVLVVYSESPLLASDVHREYAYFRKVAKREETEEFLPLVDVKDHPLQPPSTMAYADFQRAAAALLDALRAESQPEHADLPARERNRHPVLLAAGGAPLELPARLPTPAQLVFGSNIASGVAVGAAADYDPGVVDGAIPYASPAVPLRDPPDQGTSFALMSCQYPAGVLDEPVAYASYRRVVERIGAPPEERLRFVVLTGDQVYVDPTAGLYDPSARDGRYKRPYEAWLRQRDVRAALRRIPSFMLLDDHEIDDNWEPITSELGSTNDDKRTQGLKAYETYQRARVAHDVPPGPGVGESFDFRFDGFPFFMLDTRSARGVRTVAGLATASLFTEATLTALKEWLTTQPRGIPKFIVTPSMLLPRHRRAIQHAPAGGGLDASNLSALHSDGWDGYPSTLSAVLGFIAESKIPHVVFLSGDEHRGCVASIELHDASGTHVLARLHSLHTTAAYAPFPFANSLDSDYTLSETIEFRYGAAKYQCVVRAKLPQTGDGALLLRPRKENGTWKLDYEYADARGTIEI